MRQQIPCPYDELKKLAQQQQQEGNTSTKVKKKATLCNTKRTQKFVDQLDSLLQQIDGLFVGRSISYAAILFGTTTVNPKEIYSFEFEYDESDTDVSDSVANDCCRRVIRNLVMNPPESFKTDLVPTKMHLLIKSDREQTITNFFPRQAFKLKAQKLGFQMTLNGKKHTTHPMEIDDKQTIIAETKKEHEIENAIWYQSSFIVVGISVAESFPNTTLQ